MSRISNQINHPSDTTVAMPSRTFHYGSAAGAAAPSVVGLPVAHPDLALRLKFAVGEILGFLFVLASTGYIFVVPSSLSRPALMRAMINRLVKRTLDIIGASIGIILCTPFWMILPIVIKLNSNGPVFYTQTRVGINRRRKNRRCFPVSQGDDRRGRERRRENYMGKPFKVIKFRTMVQDAEKLSGPVWATKNDARITKVGRFLRKTRLDEIPQFINVLKGDMALVGPRPERPSFVRELSSKVEDYSGRLDVKPGLTGLAQIENGYDSSVASVAEKVRFDLQYIRNWSLWYDFKIMFKTVIVVFTGKGAC
ncbi:sugar transferase [candidate division GN15 bacterium]|uniref:Sugar transferase n=1 Tax=candidate division GN15 bacterium TaxID=2072418 RepID=A0A855X5F5_9BACT|nr:MAG: sugar transferase [candidate division GN15 bacterium]